MHAAPRRRPPLRPRRQWTFSGARRRQRETPVVKGLFESRRHLEAVLRYSGVAHPRVWRCGRAGGKRCTWRPDRRSRSDDRGRTLDLEGRRPGLRLADSGGIPGRRAPHHADEQIHRGAGRPKGIAPLVDSIPGRLAREHRRTGLDAPGAGGFGHSAGNSGFSTGSRRQRVGATRPGRMRTSRCA
jgi:hypothetical protein